MIGGARRVRLALDLVKAMEQFNGEEGGELWRVGFTAMGGPAEILIPHRSFEAAAVLAIEEIERIETKYSRYLATSLLTHLNQRAGLGEWVEVDAETMDLLRFADDLYRRSGGAFDLTSGALRNCWDFCSGRIPSQDEIEAVLARIGWRKVLFNGNRITFQVSGMEIDFGGIGKEYAVDRACQLLVSLGVQHAMVNLAGDIALTGPLPGGGPWKIGIAEPEDPAALRWQVSLTQGGLATSGDYARCVEIDGRRHGHLLNPQTGWPVRGLASVTVCAETCLEAGALASIAILKEAGGALWLESNAKRYAWIDVNGQAHLNL